MYRVLTLGGGVFCLILSAFHIFMDRWAAVVVFSTESSSAITFTVNSATHKHTGELRTLAKIQQGMVLLPTPIINTTICITISIFIIITANYITISIFIIITATYITTSIFIIITATYITTSIFIIITATYITTSIFIIITATYITTSIFIIITATYITISIFIINTATYITISILIIATYITTSIFIINTATYITISILIIATYITTSIFIIITATYITTSIFIIITATYITTSIFIIITATYITTTSFIIIITATYITTTSIFIIITATYITTSIFIIITATSPPPSSSSSQLHHHQHLHHHHSYLHHHQHLHHHHSYITTPSPISRNLPGIFCPTTKLAVLLQSTCSSRGFMGSGWMDTRILGPDRTVRFIVALAWNSYTPLRKQAKAVYMEYSQEVQSKTKSIKEHKNNVIFRFQIRYISLFTVIHVCIQKIFFLGHMFKKLADFTQHKHTEHIKFSVLPLKKSTNTHGMIRTNTRTKHNTLTNGE